MIKNLQQWKGIYDMVKEKKKTTCEDINQIEGDTRGRHDEKSSTM